MKGVKIMYGTYKGSIAEALDTGYDGKVDQGLYKGKLINKYLKFSDKGYFRFDFKIDSTDSKFLQGIVIMLSRDFNADFYINGKKIAKPKGRFPKIELWENNVPQEFSVFVHLVEGDIYFLNGCAIPVTPELTYCRMMQGGCAIFIEQICENCYRLNCNDVEPDDDFNDLVYEVNWTKIFDGSQWLTAAKKDKRISD